MQFPFWSPLSKVLSYKVALLGHKMKLLSNKPSINIFWQTPHIIYSCIQERFIWKFASCSFNFCNAHLIFKVSSYEKTIDYGDGCQTSLFIYIMISGDHAFMNLKGKCKICSLCNFRGRFSRQEDTQDMWSPSSASLRVELRAGTLEGASVFFLPFSGNTFICSYSQNWHFTKEQGIISVDFLEVIAGRKLWIIFMQL